jgi:hypothetical protein
MSENKKANNSTLSTSGSTKTLQVKTVKPPPAKTTLTSVVGNSLTNTSQTKASDNGELEDMSDHDLILFLIQEVKKLTQQTTKTAKAVSSFDAKLKAQDIKITEHNAKIAKLEESNKDLVKTVSDYSKILQSQGKQIEQQNITLDQLENQLEENYCKNNEQNIIIKGLNLTKSSSPHDEVNCLFEKLKIQPKVISTKQLGRSRKILVRFEKSESKGLLYKQAKFLRTKGIALEDDLPPKMRSDRNVLLQHRRQLFDNGTAKSIKVLKKGLLVDEKDYYTLDRRSGIVSKSKPRPQLQNSA